MTVKNKEVDIRTFILICLFAVLCSLGSKVQAVEVIANSSVKIDKLTRSELRRIYTMRQSVWATNIPVIVYALPNNSPTHQSFCKKELRIFPYQLDRIWNKLTYSGMGVAPIVVESEEMMMRLVSKTPGAIGYVEGHNTLFSSHTISIED